MNVADPTHERAQRNARQFNAEEKEWHAKWAWEPRQDPALAREVLAALAAIAERLGRRSTSPYCQPRGSTRLG